MTKNENANDRITRLRRRYLNDTPVISIQRARYYTEKWQSLDPGLHTGIRVALAMKNVYENMAFSLDPDDRIAGTWTEHFLGIPIDIERGLFNQVMEIELDKHTMILYLIKTNLKFMRYLLKKYGIVSLLKNLRQTKSVGAAMPSIGTDTLDRRKVNPYQISPRDKKRLKRKLLPFWKGKTIADLLKTELDQAGIHRGDMESFYAAMPPATSRNDFVISIGAAMGTWQGHLILDHESVLKKGLLAMRSEVREQIKQSGHMGDEAVSFLKSIEIALDGIIIYATRLAEKISNALAAETDSDQKARLARMLDTCRNVPMKPASGFLEAVQSYWTVKTAVELAMPFNVHSPGRLDQLFYPYFEKDLAEGNVTAEAADTLFQELFLKIMGHNMRPYSNFNSYFAQRYEGSEPVTMGGLTREGNDAANALTYIMLEAAGRSKAALNFVVRLHKGSPSKLRLKVADLQYRGNSSISIMNDDMGVSALEKRGFSREDARDYAVTGCVDMCAPGKTGGEAFCALLLCRVLDMTLRNGSSNALVCMVENTGLETGDPDTFTDFDQFLDAFHAQARLQIENIVKASRTRDRLYATHLPSPHISAFMQGCLEKKKDVTRGGAVYDLEGILFMNSIANLVDSLYVIKKFIFEQKRFSFKELVSALDNNFVGHEDMYRRIIDLPGKWGNGHPESDELAKTVTSRLFDETYNYKTYKGGIFAPFINSMTSHTYDGRIFTATPDGRKAAKPFAASCNPYNVDRFGPTGVLRSVAALDFSQVLGCAVNIRMHPSGIGESEATRKKWVSLIDTYFKMGGAQLQPTVVSTEVLKSAQADPDSHQDVIVKVGGYSAYFVDLGHEIQEEIISRSEHL